MTPAVKTLKNSGLAYRLHEYIHDPRAASFGPEAAEKLGVEPSRVFKTLVLCSAAGEYSAWMLPVDRHLDLKEAARISGEKKMELSDPKEAERITGYIVGGISPLGQKKRLPLFIDSRALEHKTILFSGGKRGLQIEMAPSDFIKISSAAASGNFS
ncbi:Cys-tRNA(Pro) deacylase [Marispirochaeta sp.]|jgi:Cys-tRNA(Pro)/Cys-tRNA(Cys) deacylase|uniref:Cys-tRNA(Pro) deacylase n=1 Tax=Marispirochaeta sp. TaxID=2038653 RepID=UPI0029C62864|nr:Cys-tRNA(Pro) deacylase [Marispirochaeta sp.]